ncbi:MAG: hypothetical protein JJU45_12140, partial [Acidimicrobiia bacterium]|nr:hypothetical protein [Acidimicrobiia bacterium]
MASSEPCDCGGHQHAHAAGDHQAAGATTTDVRPPAPPPYRPDAESSWWPEAPTSRRAKLTAGLGAAGLGAACLYTASLDPSEGGVYPLCPLRALTGTDCALCGG